MNLLPAELLDLVFAQCDHATQKILRRVSRKCEKSATPHVFEHVYLAMFDECLQNFSRLAVSPFAKHIKRLTLYSDILPTWNQDEWLAQVAPTQTLSPLFIEEHYEAFLARRQQQVSWVSRSHADDFQQALCLPSNIEETIVVRAMSLPSGRVQWPYLRYLVPQVSQNREEWLCNPDGSCRTFDIGELQYYHWRTNELSDRAALCLVEAIGARAKCMLSKPITKFSLQNCLTSRYEALIDETYPGQPTPVVQTPAHQARFPTFLAAFDNLTELDLCYRQVSDNLHDLDEEERYEMMRSIGEEMTTMLCRARHLKRLRLQYGNADDEHFLTQDETFMPQRDTVFTHTLGPLFAADPTPWPGLTHLDLSVSVKPAMLVPFLARLGPTLRSLTLRDMDVGDIARLAAPLPRVLKLEHVRLSNVHTTNFSQEAWGGSCRDVRFLFEVAEDPGDEEALYDYLLGRRDTLPDMGLDPHSDDEEEYYADFEEYVGGPLQQYVSDAGESSVCLVKEQARTDRMQDAKGRSRSLRAMGDYRAGHI